MTRTEETLNQDARTRQALEYAASWDLTPTIVNNKDVDRRKKAERNFKAWVETYLQDLFPLTWASYHLKMLKAIDDMLLRGGHQAIAAPRAGGKSAICEAALLYAGLTGRCKYGIILTATAKLAPKSMAAIKTILHNNEMLLQDYELLIRPLLSIAASGSAARCRNLKINEQHLWSPGGDTPINKNRIVLPITPGEPGSNAVIEVWGLLEAVRGVKYSTGSEIVRPDIALVDDPQTAKSAKSPTQCQERKEAIMAGVSRLGGPAKDISMMMAVTVIKQGDMADEMLDRTKHPEMHGIRTAWFERWPEGMNPRIPGDRSSSAAASETSQKWDEYIDIYRDELRTGSRKGQKAKKFYRDNRKILDRNAKVSWPQRKLDCVSAIEYGMRMYLLDSETFLAEMQNDPGVLNDQLASIPDVNFICDKQSGHVRYEVPLSARAGTFFIDCHQNLLYYTVGFFGQHQTGVIVDYDAWPKQPGSVFEHSHPRKPIHRHPRVNASTDEGKLFQALTLLVEELTNRQWKMSDGTECELNMGLIDAGWNTSVVHEFCAGARKFGVKCIPSIGTSFGVNKTPMTHWSRKRTKGIIGENWYYPPKAAGRPCRHVLFDANRRKMSLFRALNIPLGDPGSLSLYELRPIVKHRLFAEHLTSSSATKCDTDWGDLILFTLPPHREDHYLDCASGVLTAASMLGIKPSSVVSSSVISGMPQNTRSRGGGTTTSRKAKPKPRRVTYMNV